MHRVTSTQSLNRTRNGMLRLTVISFSASRVTPLQASYLGST